jgi:hypothetical protein
MRAKRRRERARRSKQARKQTKPVSLTVPAQPGAASKSRFGRLISAIKSPSGILVVLILSIVALVDRGASLVELANLFRDYYLVEPEIVASEIDPRDPFYIPFSIKNDSSWWTLYNANPICMFDATTDCYEITDAQTMGHLPGLGIKGDIEPRKQVPFRCNIRIPERPYRSLRVGVFVSYGVRLFPILPIRKRETYAEFHAIWDSTGRPRWMPGPMLGATPRPFERRTLRPDEQFEASMKVRKLPSCTRKEGWWMEGH